MPQLACTLLSQMGQGPSRLGEVPDIVRLAPQNPALAQGDHHEPERSLTKACTSVTNLTSGPSDSPYLGLGGEGAAENKTAPGNTEGKEAGESSGSFAAPCTVQVQASKISRKQEKRSQGRLQGPLKGGQVAGHRPRLRCAGLQSHPWGPLRQPPPPPAHERWCTQATPASLHSAQSRVTSGTAHAQGIRGTKKQGWQLETRNQEPPPLPRRAWRWLPPRAETLAPEKHAGHLWEEVGAVGTTPTHAARASPVRARTCR